MKDSSDGTCYIFDVQSPMQQEQTCSGRLGFPRSPDPIMLGDKIVYSIDKSFVHGLGLSIAANNSARQQEDNNVELNKDSRVKCYICDAIVKLKDMRKHVGKHVLSNTLQHTLSTCGYCGRSSCESHLKQTSRKKGQVYYRTETNCRYRFEIFKKLRAKKCQEHVF